MKNKLKKLLIILKINEKLNMFQKLSDYIAINLYHNNVYDRKL